MRALRRGRKDNALAAALTLALVASVVTAAIRTDGFHETRVDLNEGGVWVTRSAGAQAGRLNTQIKTIELAISGTDGLDVAQSGPTVVMFDAAKGQMEGIDAAIAAKTDVRKIPKESVVAIGGDVGVVAEPSKGRVWLTAPESLAALDVKGTDPTFVAKGKDPGLAVAAGTDGTVHVYRSGTEVTQGVHRDGDPDVSELDAPVADASITAVGGQVVLLDGRTGLLTVPGRGEVDLSSHGKGLQLQEPGPVSDRVLVATDDGLLAVPLSGGEPEVLVDGALGGAARPVLVAGCAYGAWGTSPQWARSCAGDAAGQRVSAFPGEGGLAGGTTFRFRTNRDRVVLNDVTTGVNLTVDEEVPVVVKDWTEALDKDRDDDVPQQQAAQREQKACSDRPDAPKTEDDSVGTRPERPVIAPVLDNDSSDRCDVLTVQPFAKDELPDPEVATVSIVGGGSAIQVTPAADRTEEIVITYHAVGKGGATPARLTVKVSSDGVNGDPVPVEDTTVVESGQTVRHNVLVNDTDPDGDALNLTAVVPDKVDGSVPKFQANGLVTYTAPGGFVGTVTLPYTVTDERDATAQSALTVRVVSAGGNINPTARNDRQVAFVGKEAKVDLLANDTDPNGDDLKVVEVEEVAGLEMEVPTDGILRVTPTAEGAYYFTYVIDDGDSGSAEATVYLEAREPKGNSRPVAVRDDLVLRPSTPGLVDLVANDLDADGDLLAVTSLVVDPGSGLSAELLDMRVARVTASAAFQRSSVVSYTVSDGAQEASGKLVVRPNRYSGLDQPPVAVDDTATVRAGKATAIEVLRNDVDPEGEQLTLVEVEPVDPAVGRIFVQDDQLRFQAASGATRSVTTTYTVSDPGQNKAAAQVRIDVVPTDAANQPPRPPRLDARVFAGRSVSIPVPLIGLDPDGDTVAITGVVATDPPRKGSVEVVGDGFVYAADRGASGPDGFTFVVTDDQGLTATGRVRIVVAPTPKTNTPPSALPDKVRVAPGARRTIEVLDNDIDIDQDRLALLGTGKDAPTQPPKGLGTVAVDGNRITYEAPASIPDATAQASFTYAVSDGRGGVARGVVTVTIDAEQAPNQPPIALDDLVPTQLVNTEVDVAVLANDRDPDAPGATLEVDVPDFPAAQVLEDGTLRVSVGTKPITFVYEVTDADGGTALALVSIPVATSLPPIAVLDTVKMEAGATKAIDVVANDRNPGGKQGDLKLLKILNERGGTTELKDGKAYFTAKTDWAGDAGFAYVVGNGKQQSAGTARISLTGQDLPPIFLGTTVELPAGASRQLQLEGLVEDLDTEEHTFRLTGGTVAGSIDAKVAGAVLTITANGEARGKKTTLALEIKDGKNTIEGTIPVTVAENDSPPPVAVDDVKDTIQGKAVDVAVTANDIDGYGKGLTVKRADVAGGAGTGTASYAGGSITFTPNAAFFGVALITYVVEDGTKDVDRNATGTVRVTVYGRPGAPPAPSGTVESHLVRLTWSEPANNGAPITGYIVESDVGGVRTQVASPAATIDGLKNATAYRFRVAAINRAVPDTGTIDAKQWSPWSPALVPDQFPDRPAAPVATFKTEANNGGAGGVLHVSFTAPRVDGTPITGYTLRSSPASGGDKKLPPGTTSYDWTGLTNGVPYTFSLVATNKAGDSEASPSSAPALKPAGVPSAPTNVTSKRDAGSRNDDGGWVNVSWGAADANGDPEGLAYRVTSNPGTRTETTDGTSIDWSGLDPNVAYTFTVVPFNKAGDGAGGTSAAVYAEGKPAPPASPRFLPANGSVQTSGIDSANKKGPGAITYEYSTDNSFFTRFDGGAFSLGNGTTVSVWVRACKYAPDSNGATVGCGPSAQASNARTGATTVTPFGPLTPTSNPALTSGHAGTTITWNWGNAPGVESTTMAGQSGGSSCGATCYSKSFGYNERHCIRVDASGQGVTQTGTERCETTDPPPYYQGVVNTTEVPINDAPRPQVQCGSSCSRLVRYTTQGEVVQYVCQLVGGNYFTNGYDSSGGLSNTWLRLSAPNEFIPSIWVTGTPKPAC